MTRPRRGCTRKARNTRDRHACTAAKEGEKPEVSNIASMIEPRIPNLRPLWPLERQRGEKAAKTGLFLALGLGILYQKSTAFSSPLYTFSQL